VARDTVARLPGPRGARCAAEVHGDDDPGYRGRATGGSGDAAVYGRCGRTSFGVADLTYVATWRGFVYVTFVIDVFSRRIVGCGRRPRCAATWRSSVGAGALDRPLIQAEPLVHYSDRACTRVQLCVATLPV